LRYTDERQHTVTSVFGNPLPNAYTSFEKPTWRLALDHQFAADVHGYVSYNRGIRAGGFDLLPPGLGQTAFFPETLDAFEVGMKSELIDHKLRFNASVFDYEYKDIQVQTVPAGSGGIVETSNAAKARINGLDVDFEALLTKGLTLSGGFTQIFQGKYEDFKSTAVFGASPLTPFPPGYCQANSPPGSCLIDASGNPVIRTPKFSGNLSPSYRMYSAVGTFPISVTLYHNSGFAWEAADRFRQDAYTLLNASFGWTSTDNRYGVSLWGYNLTNKYYLSSGVASSLGDLTIPAAPRTYGITVSGKFGGGQ
jgi:iron complex outermembrane receptor protein